MCRAVSASTGSSFFLGNALALLPDPTRSSVLPGPHPSQGPRGCHGAPSHPHRLADVPVKGRGYDEVVRAGAPCAIQAPPGTGSIGRRSMTEKNSSVSILGDSRLISAGRADVTRIRERTRRIKLVRAGLVLGGIAGYLVYRYAGRNPLKTPTFGPDAATWAPGI